MPFMGCEKLKKAQVFPKIDLKSNLYVILMLKTGLFIILDAISQCAFLSLAVRTSYCTSHTRTLGIYQRKKSSLRVGC